MQKVLIIRSKDRVDSTGRGRSMGYGFVEFANHKHALEALRATNNNPAIFGPDRRPIVEFALESSLVLKTKQRRSEKAQQKQQDTEEHARHGQPRTNKERRLERNQKRRETRQRKREAKKMRKLDQVNDSKGGQIAKHSNGANNTEKSANVTLSKAKKVNFSPRTDFAGSRKINVDKKDQQKSRQFS